METVSLKCGDTLIVDPCYIKNVSDSLGGQARFDALKLEKVLHDGDDGVFEINYDGKNYTLGVDSGRIWAMRAEFECSVTLGAGYSGFATIRKDENV